MFIRESGAVIVLSMLSLMFTPSFDENMTFMKTVYTSLSKRKNVILGE